MKLAIILYAGYHALYQNNPTLVAIKLGVRSFEAA